MIPAQSSALLFYFEKACKQQGLKEKKLPSLSSWVTQLRGIGLSSLSFSVHLSLRQQAATRKCFLLAMKTSLREGF